ncbi:MAG: serine hydrolase [Prolixibacteraceae bacterium]|nr:serine hydrolase [Prolixibacteraceae bacterium]
MKKILTIKHLILLSVLVLYAPFSPDKAIGLELFSSYEMNRPLNQRIKNYQTEFEYSPYIDQQVTRFMERSALKGVSIAIIENEKLVFNKSYGFADETSMIAATPEHLYRIASVSKLITAITVMKLVEEGKMQLSDPVFGPKGYFNEPEYLDIRDRQLLDIEVLHLLNHTSGWTQRYGDPMFLPIDIAKIVGDEPPASIDTYVKYAISRRLHAKPGSMYSYSNMAYAFMGAIIEKVSGMPYEDYVKYHILYPNGIFDMHIGRNLYEQRRSNEVRYYEQDGSNLVPAFTGDSLLLPKTYGGNDIELLGAAGGWIASAPELAKLLTLVDGFDKVPDILSPESIALMTLEDRKALGWRDVKEGIWIRTGSFAGTSAMIVRRPDGLQWVFLTNTSNWQGSRFTYDINQLMNRITNRVDSWPDMDLFGYYDTEILSSYTLPFD